MGVAEMIESLQPYFALIASLLSLATLGFILRLASIMRTAAKEREEVLNSRLQAVEDDLKRTEKWAERSQKELGRERDNLKTALSKKLEEAGIGFLELVAGQSLNHVSDELQTAIKELTNKMEDLQNSHKLDTSPEFNRSLAESHMAQHQWREAARYFHLADDEYYADWEFQFARGVANANIRGGDTENMEAYRAYCQAIVFFPPNESKNTLARLYVYRGAMLKRLRRLDEAQNDVRLGFELSQDHYEKTDAAYNLASISAMKNDKTEMMEYLRIAVKNDAYRSLIIKHIDHYFSNFSEDEDFLSLVKR